LFGAVVVPPQLVGAFAEVGLGLEAQHSDVVKPFFCELVIRKELVTTAASIAEAIITSGRL